MGNAPSGPPPPPPPPDPAIALEAQRAAAAEAEWQRQLQEQQKQAAEQAEWQRRVEREQQQAAEENRQYLQQQAAAAQAAALAAAETQRRAAEQAAAQAAEDQRLAQLQIERARAADELAQARAQVQSVSAQLASSQAETQAQAAAATTARTEATDSGQSVTSHLYTDMGCWNDMDGAMRAISGGFVGTPVTNAYNTSRCYELAKSRGHNIFAVQAGYACFTGLEMRDNYKKYGAAAGACPVGGGPWVNHVYKINSPDVVIPHDVPQYSDWSAVPSLFSEFQTQASNLWTSLASIDTSNPAPYMTALDTNVNAIRDAATIQKLKVQNSQNIEDATTIFKNATDMSGPIKDSKDQAEKLRREISLSSGQNSGFEGNLLPLQILTWTLVGAIVLHFVAGALLPSVAALTLVFVGLACGFGAAVYFAINKQS